MTIVVTGAPGHLGRRTVAGLLAAARADYAEAAMLQGYGITATVAETVADIDAGTARGDLLSDDGSLRG